MKVVQPDNRDEVLGVRNKIQSLMQHINHVKDELYRTKDMANMTEKYWKNVIRFILFFTLDTTDTYRLFHYFSAFRWRKPEIIS